MLAVVLAFGIFRSTVALAAPATLSILGPAPAGALQPGARVEVSWPAAADLHGFDEMELVLSVDGGRTFPVRVTGRIAPAGRRFPWTVPALPAARARLALRAGTAEEDEDETIVGVSEPFSIAPSEGTFEELFRVGDEGRTRAALEDLPPRGLPNSLRDGIPTLLAGGNAVDLGEGPSTLHADSCRSRESWSPVVPNPHAAVRPARPAGSSPAPLPLRL